MSRWLTLGILIGCAAMAANVRDLLAADQAPDAAIAPFLSDQTFAVAAIDLTAAGNDRLAQYVLDLTGDADRSQHEIGRTLGEILSRLRRPARRPKLEPFSTATSRRRPNRLSGGHLLGRVWGFHQCPAGAGQLWRIAVSGASRIETGNDPEDGQGHGRSTRQQTDVDMPRTPCLRRAGRAQAARALVRTEIDSTPRPGGGLGGCRPAAATDCRGSAPLVRPGSD